MTHAASPAAERARDAIDKPAAPAAGGAASQVEPLSDRPYARAPKKLHIELVKLQPWVIAWRLTVCTLFEGRDGAGKGGSIKAITERVSPRIFRVVALPAPLIAVGASIAASWLLGLQAAGVSMVGLIPQGLPLPTLPDPALAAQLAPGALGIALMSFTEPIAAGHASCCST